MVSSIMYKKLRSAQVRALKYLQYCARKRSKAGEGKKKKKTPKKGGKGVLFG
jgi:hypothetical protein